MPDLMRQTRLGKLDLQQMIKSRTAGSDSERKTSTGRNLIKKLSTWMADFTKDKKGASKKSAGHNLGSYRKLIDRLPKILRFVPGAGKLGDIKHYLLLFCYFLQPTPNNIRSMILYAIKFYVPDHKSEIQIPSPEIMPAVGIYHPDAPKLFDSFNAYKKWYDRRALRLDPDNTFGLLLMRPQIISGTAGHYDGLIRAIEREGVAVIPAISTFMDNREAATEFFVDDRAKAKQSKNGLAPRVSQILSLTGFSFVGGPAMNDSDAAVEFFRELGVPLRSAVSLDIQSIENWEETFIGLNPIQTAMQVAIPELDGSTEPFIFGGMPSTGEQPIPIEERCTRLARRLKRWRRLRSKPKSEIKLALTLFCFPPNKGNVGTAAELDVFPSVFHILNRLREGGYTVNVPSTVDELQNLILGANSNDSAMPANIAYRMSVDEYYRLCPYVDEIEAEWGRPPGQLNSNGRDLLIQGIHLGNVFIGIQPTFGYEGDPMKMLMAQGGTPHHGFMGFYKYIEDVFCSDAVIHVGTHGALEFMPGKQVGLSGNCWPDRLIGELPNVYIYSVNNPSEGTIAKRRSYAELISYLTPPIENAGLYKDLASLKELLTAYRQSNNEEQRVQLFASIEEVAQSLNLQ
jgi:magnesium chelatase subunit H